MYQLRKEDWRRDPKKTTAKKRALPLLYFLYRGTASSLENSTQNGNTVFLFLLSGQTHMISAASAFNSNKSLIQFL